VNDLTAIHRRYRIRAASAGAFMRVSFPPLPSAVTACIGASSGRPGNRFARLLAGFLLAACSIASPAASPIQSEGNNVSTSAPIPSPPRDAAELLQRMLGLIDVIREPEDLTPERMTWFVGLPMVRQDKPHASDYTADQELTDIWAYYFAWRLHPTIKRPYLYFSFYETEKYRNKPRPPMTEICQFDMARFHDALLELGYEQVGNTRWGTPARQYRHGSVDVQVGYVGESGESLEKISHHCVYKVMVEFVVTLEELKQ
jgi:hypothetical protein